MQVTTKKIIYLASLILCLLCPAYSFSDPATNPSFTQQKQPSVTPDKKDDVLEKLSSLIKSNDKEKENKDKDKEKEGKENKVNTNTGDEMMGNLFNNASYENFESQNNTAVPTYNE